MLVRERSTLPARLAEADGRWDDAVAGYESALEDEPALAPYGQAREVRVRLAHALLRCGRTAAAARALDPVFERVHRHGDVGGVLFAGRQVLATLAGASWGPHLGPAQASELRQWATRLGHAATAAQPAAVAAPTPPGRELPSALPSAPPPDTPLSSREHEVLSRLAAGDSNKLIARTFDLSPHTVKRHVANILDKLGLESRGQAAAWYRARQGN
jgi:LuxR family maltose regulon positive regulatory protein